MFKLVFNCFIRGFAKTSNKKSLFINNSLISNNKKKLTPTKNLIKIEKENKIKRIEFHESHSRRGHIIKNN